MGKTRNKPGTDVAIVKKPETSGGRSALSSFRRKTMVGILRTWRDATDAARLAITGTVEEQLPKKDRAHVRKLMENCLHPKGGEITARKNTVELGKLYLSLNEVGRRRFLHILAQDYDVDRKVLKAKMLAVREAETLEDSIIAEQALSEALVSPRATILRQLNSLPDGFKFLVDMRASLLPLARRFPEMSALEYDLRKMLGSWFDIGLLDLVEISWDSPASLLEKLIAYEAVHKIRSWDDLRNRLDSDRRIYAFFHNKMPSEPLIFVQVALVKGLASSIQTILDETQPVQLVEEADTAIFYSISNAQQGLAGISFGNFLIKRVVEELVRQHKNIKQFATLSPIPGFRKWLNAQLDTEVESLFTQEDYLALGKLPKKENAHHWLKETLKTSWHEDAKLADRLKPVLVRLCAHYLLEQKKGKKALDAVAHFHLTNGAQLEQINWLADISANGLKQSCGMMVNYYYKLDDIEENHERYVSNGRIAASRKARGLLKS